MAVVNSRIGYGKRRTKTERDSYALVHNRTYPEPVINAHLPIPV